MTECALTPALILQVDDDLTSVRLDPEWSLKIEATFSSEN